MFICVCIVLAAFQWGNISVKMFYKYILTLGKFEMATPGCTLDLRTQLCCEFSDTEFNGFVYLMLRPLWQ